jgi:hypothetical protein
MAKKPEKPVYSFVRRGNALQPELAYDVHALDGITQGQRVRLNIQEWRNFDRLKAYWAMLHDVVDATEAAPTAERLHEVLKLENGFVDFVALPNGFKVAIPASVALDKMSEPEFIAFFQTAERWLAATYGYVPPKRERRAA